MSNNDGNGGIIQSIWRSRIILLAGFSLVGIGAIIGAGSVYIFYMRRKLHEIFQIQSSLSSQVQSLKKEVDKVNENLSQASSTNTAAAAAAKKGAGGSSGDKASITGRSIKSKSKKKSKEKEKFGSSTGGSRTGSELSSDEEFATAGSSDPDVKVTSNTEDFKHLDIPTNGAESWIVDFLMKMDTKLDGDSSSQHDAYIQLQNSKDKLDGYCGFWWRYAKATHLESTAAGQVGDDEMKKSLTFAAFNRASKALQMNKSSANAHKWYAITLGSKGEYLSINDKIKNGFIFKDHIDIAVKINPKDPNLHYLLGRFCLEVSNLSWFERKIAATLFSSPPSATPQEALDHFRESERLGKPSKENRFYMAKTYITLKNNENAAYWLKKTVEMPVLNNSDKPTHDEAVKMFSKYKSYLK